MSSNRVVRDLFRSLENTLQERLAMIEDVLRLGNVRQPGEEDGELDTAVLEKLVRLEEMVSSLSSRLNALELKREVAPVPVETVRVTHIGKERILEQDMKDLEVSVKAETGAVSVKAEPVPIKAEPVPIKAETGRVAAARVEIPTVVEPVILNETIQIENEATIDDGSEEVEEEVVEEEVVEEEVVEEEVVEEEVVEEEVVEEEAEEAEEGEALELEEFEYKGKTYYKDGENQVYVLADDEEPQVIGTWDEARKRVLFRRAG